ncbi:nucleoside deaminase [Neobacillus piezotolerans]|uniref:Nucleoside deaminase n=1 Tax=Neobacillus piezotolerans TaxID=2259171 RepID=A0A3D8GRX4_9BACI|nr:nucleoside deaminase [Neobacillus piezotolerans]RDU37230.1 nucleoside deaminase [Neobacillus piezotolerans]
MKWMEYTVELARKNQSEKGGKPFGAVIVKDGEMMAEGVNDVLETHDPTTHAELQAISRASRLLKTDDLTGCEIYASGEPCPMCLSAIYLSNISKAYFANPAEGNPLRKRQFTFTSRSACRMNKGITS